LAKFLSILGKFYTSPSDCVSRREGGSLSGNGKLTVIAMVGAAFKC